MQIITVMQLQQIVTRGHIKSETLKAVKVSIYLHI